MSKEIKEIHVYVEGIDEPLSFPEGTPDHVIDRVVQRQVAARIPQKPSNPLEAAYSAVAEPIEPLMTMASGIPAAIGSGIAGLGVAGLDEMFGSGEGSKAGAHVQQSVQDALTYEPRSQGGQERAQELSEMLAPLAEGISSVEQGFGRETLRATDSPELATAAHTAPTAFMEAIGLASARPLTRVARKTRENVPKYTKELIEVSSKAKIPELPKFNIQTPAKKRIIERITSGKASDSERARYKVVDAHEKGKKLIKDKKATTAIGAGLDEGSVAIYKGSNPKTRSMLRKMLNVAERRVNDKRFGVLTRPGDVVGDVLLQRISHVNRVNREAGGKLDEVAKGLKGRQVDFDGVVNQFIDDLYSDLGVRVVNGKPVFTDSIIDGIDPSQRILTKLIHQMSSRRVPDAYGLHMMKKFIDEHVGYGKRAEGLGGKTENIVKRLRHNIDSLLDESFPSYDKVNSIYSETRGVLDSMQDAAGSKIDFGAPNAEKAAGVLLRRLMSNVQSRSNLINAVTDVDKTALKYAGSNGRLPVVYGKGVFDEDILALLMFADDLDTLIKPAAQTSLAGEVAKGMRSGVRSPREAAMDMAIDRMFSQSPQDIIDLIRPILED